MLEAQESRFNPLDYGGGNDQKSRGDRLAFDNPGKIESEMTEKAARLSSSSVGDDVSAEEMGAWDPFEATSPAVTVTASAGSPADGNMNSPSARGGRYEEAQFDNGTPVEMNAACFREFSESGGAVRVPAASVANANADYLAPPPTKQEGDLLGGYSETI
jgi:hypothetical protein